MKRMLTIAAVTLLIVASPHARQDPTQALATPSLPPDSRLKAVRMDASVKDCLTFIGHGAGITLQYDQNVPRLDQKFSVNLNDVTLDDALKAVLGPNGLTFLALSKSAVFVYEDTPQNRQKFSMSIQIFALKNADPQPIFQLIMERVASDPTGVRPVVLADKEKRTITVRATADKMALIATLIADNDKR